MNTYLYSILGALVVVPLISFADHPQEASHTDVHTMTTSSTLCTYESVGVGSRGEAVTCLQRVLIDGGFLTGIDAPTGYFGPLTKDALMKWQEKHGIAQTGYFGTLSKTALVAHGSSTKETKETLHAEHTPLDISSWPLKPSVSLVY